MDEKIDNGGPAFPVCFEGGSNNGECPQFDEGMSKREHFASLILQGMLSNPVYAEIHTMTEMARMSTSVADTLIAALRPSP